MIDIIIPVYNTPTIDLERCFNSINKQTFNDYKVYLIDDGSNNETKAYLDNYVKDNDHYIVNHINNGGVSNARNIGIEISNSKYLTFVDSDDTLEESFLEEAYELIEDNNLDLIIGGYNEIENGVVTRVRKSLPGLYIYENDSINNFKEKLISGKTSDRNKEINDLPTGRIYTRVFKRDSLKNLKFNTNLHISEDTLFMIDYVTSDKRIGIIDKVWYNYYINSYSISNNTDIDRIKDFIKEIEIRLENENNNIIKEAYKQRIIKANNYIKEIYENN